MACALRGCACAALSAPLIAGAFDEGDARFHRIARQRLEREHQRPLHQAVDHQAVLVGIDVGRAGMAALEMQPARRDHAVEQLSGVRAVPMPWVAGLAGGAIVRTTLLSNCDGWP